MFMRQPDSAQADYLTKLMITDISHSLDTLGNYTGYFEAIAADTGYLPGPAFHEPIAEPQVATVTDNKDGQGRVQVKFDWQVGASTSEWIRVMSPDAGSSGKVSKNRGFVAIPEVGDQVMVGFVHNHPDRPYVMGGLFHGKAGGGGGAGNNVKSLSSKSGNMIQLHDGEGSVFIKDHGTADMKFDGNGNVATNAKSNHTVNAGSTNVINVGGKKGAPPQSLLQMDAAGNIVLDGKTSITLKVGDNSITISASGITASAGKGTIDITTLAGALGISSTGGAMSIDTDSELTITAGPSAVISSGDTNVM